MLAPEEFRSLLLAAGTVAAPWPAHVSSTRSAAGASSVWAMKVPYNKLVRDRMPEIIRADGHQPVTRILDQAEYRSALVAKLLEEAQEASAAPAGDLPTELADVLEVMQALVSDLGMTWEVFLSIAASKRAERGAFDHRIFLEYVELTG